MPMQTTLDIMERFTPVRGWPIWRRYVCAAGLVGVTFLARFLLGEEAPFSPYLVFLPAIFISGLLFNRGSAFFATFLSAGLGLYFYMAVHHYYSLGNFNTIANLALFLLIGGLTSVVVELLHKVVNDLAEANRALALRESELQKSDDQKKLLLDDINHRIKNSLHAVTGLLEIGNSKIDDPAARQVIETAIRQLMVLSRVFDRLHLSQSATWVSAKEFIEELCVDLNQGVIGQRPIALRVTAAPAQIGVERAISVGLIINELLSNALKYAFPDNARGEIQVRFGPCEENCFCLEVSDTGKGIAPDAKQGSGYRLVQAFAAQLGGEAVWSGPPGTSVTIRFPAKETF